MWKDIDSSGNCFTEAADIGNGVLVRERYFSPTTEDITAIALCFVPGAYLVYGGDGSWRIEYEIS